MFTDILADMIPLLSNMSAFACRMILDMETFGSLYVYHAEKITRLIVVIRGEDLTAFLPLLNHFQVLVDLHLGTTSNADLNQSCEDPMLSTLRVLEIDGLLDCASFVLRWFAKASLRLLHSFQLQTQKTLDYSLLSHFLVRNGSNILTFCFDPFSYTGFGFDMAQGSLSAAIFPHMPRLEHLGLMGTLSIAKALDCVPKGVMDIALRLSGHDFTVYAHALNGMAEVMERPTVGGKLRTIRAMMRAPHLNRGTVSFRKALEKRVADADLPEFLQLRERASKLKANGICFLDEEGSELTDCMAAVV